MIVRDISQVELLAEFIAPGLPKWRGRNLQERHEVREVNKAGEKGNYGAGRKDYLAFLGRITRVSQNCSNDCIIATNSERSSGFRR